MLLIQVIYTVFVIQLENKLHIVFIRSQHNYPYSLVSPAFLKEFAISLITAIFSCSWNFTVSFALSSDVSVESSFKTRSVKKQLSQYLPIPNFSYYGCDIDSN